MKKMAKVWATGLMSLLFVTMFAACNLFSFAQFALSAQYPKTVLSGSSFTVTVETTNKGKTYSYTGSSTKIGAAVEIYLEQDGERYDLVCVTPEQADDEVEVTIEPEEVITQDWQCRAVLADGTKAPAGKYTMKLSFAGASTIFKNLITVV